MELLTLDEYWIPVIHPDITPNVYEISSYGRIRDSCRGEHEPEYHSTNGFDYTLMTLKDNKGVRLFSVDMLVATAFLSVPVDIESGKPLKVIHLDGNGRNNNVANLEFVEDIEEWKTIEYPGVRENTYQISNWGRIRRLKDGRIIHGWITNNGYRVFDLMGYDKNVNKLFGHRLVAMNFIERVDESLKFVNHIDGDKLNIYYQNLEWTNFQGNIQHSYDTGLNKHRKQVDQYTLSGVFIKSYDSVIDAAKSIGNPEAFGNIASCCRGCCKYSNGYIWRYHDSNKPVEPYVQKLKRVDQYSQTGILINSFDSVFDAAKTIITNGNEDEFNKIVKSIRGCCCGDTKSARNYVWKYV